MGNLFYLRTRKNNTGHSDTTTLQYTTPKTALVQYTTVKCSVTNSPLLKQSDQSKVVSLSQIRYKKVSEPTLNKLYYTT